MKEVREMRVFRPNLEVWIWQWEIHLSDGTVHFSKEEYDDPSGAVKTMLEIGAVIA